MNEQINITKADGTSVNGYIICYIENVTTGMRYVYYTLNETSGEGANGTVKIYVSKVNQNNPTLDTPITDEEWGTLKGYMSDALKGNVNPDVKYLPLTELGTPTSVSEKAIAMPTNYDYVNKQRGIYAEIIAVSESAPTEPETTAEEPAIVEPVVDEPAAEAEPTNEPTPVIPETPVVPEEPVPTIDSITTSEETPAPEETPVIPPVEESAPITTDDETPGTASTLTPINLDEIEQKYADMIETINKLKSQELEAAKRYNATIELSAMHNEQHANYVQNEQSKELADESTPALDSMTTPEETPEISSEEPAVVEPTTPADSEPTTLVSDTNIETNWFDMPAS